MLLVAATEPELCGHDGLVCGVGPVEAAVRTARALAASRPEAVLHVGLAGVRRDAGLAVGSFVVGERSVYEDLLTTLPLSPRELAGAPELVAAASSFLGVEPTTIGTSGRVGGAGGCDVEAMEGFAVLRACELAGVPAVEVRAISNHVEDERAAWRMDEALEALAEALPGLVAALGAAVPGSL
jgi:futalosine hydrolase